MILAPWHPRNLYDTPIQHFSPKKFFSYLSDNASVQCILVFPSGLLFPPYVWLPVYRACFIFIHPTVFILSVSSRSHFSSMLSTLLWWLLHCQVYFFIVRFAGVILGKEMSFITLLVCKSVFLIFCAGMLDLESYLYATSIEVPLPDDTSLFMLVLLVGAPHPWIFGFILTSFKVKFKGLCFFWQPLSSTQLFLKHLFILWIPLSDTLSHFIDP